MNLIEKSLSTMIFSLNTPFTFNEITLSMDALSVLVEIDGARSLGSIGDKLQMPIGELQKTVNDLGNLNLITVAPARVKKEPPRKVQAPMPSRKDPAPSPQASTRCKQDAARLFRGIRY